MRDATRHLIVNADARRIPLPDRSVHCVVTSPPYWGLRDYGTARWEGGDAGCDHKEFRGGIGPASAKQVRSAGASTTYQYRDTCRKCGARRVDNQIGLEESPDAYVARMVEVFREVRRVLRDDGVCFANWGDSYSSGGRTSQVEPSGSIGHRGMRGSPIRPPVAPGLKPKDLVGIPWKCAFALQADGWYLRSEIIWCLSGGTRLWVKCQKGVMPMTIKDMVRLDPATVKLWNGEKWTQVLGWSQSPDRGEPLEVVLRSGERIGCTPGHVWPTQRGNVRADELKTGDVIRHTTLPGLDDPVMPSQIPDREVGWFVGLYIAEGSMDSGGTIQIAGHTKEMERFERLSALAKDYHGTCRLHIHGENSCTISLDGPMLRAIVESYVAGRTAKDKHLAVKSWQRSTYFIESVLSGYLSGDGHWDAVNRRWRLGFTENDQWAADLRTICARIGASLRLGRVNHSMAGRKFPGYRGEIRFTRSDHHNNRQDCEVIEIGRSKGRQFWDIGVEDEPHLFALASGVLTHNSKPNPMPESVRDRPTKAHEQIFLLAKRPTYFYDAEAVKEDAVGNGVETFARPCRDARAFGNPSGNEKSGAAWIGSGRNLRSVWTITPEPTPHAHFATFPRELAARCIKAGTSEAGCCPRCGKPWERVVEYKGAPRDGYSNADRQKAVNAGGGKHAGIVSGAQLAEWRANNPPKDLGFVQSCPCPPDDPVPCVVYDPFGGAGTVALVAESLGRLGIVTELSPDYCRMASGRIRRPHKRVVRAETPMPLFDRSPA